MADTQQDDVIALVLEGGIQITRWVSYSFDSQFMTPSDGFRFEIDGAEVPQAQIDALQAGAQVFLTINGFTQATGYITKVTPSEDRHGGTRYVVEGYDVFGPVVEGGADPWTLKLTAQQSVDELVRIVFGQFGFTNFEIDNSANRAVQTGLRKQRFSKKKGKPLKAYTFAQQLKPCPGEGAFAFVAKILNRAGLHCWPSADGQTVICSTPDYDQEPMGSLVRRIGAEAAQANNVLSGGIEECTHGQPSCIVATGYAGGGEWTRSKIKVSRPNEMVAFSSDRFVLDNVRAILDAHPDALELPPVFSFDPSLIRPVKRAVPIFLHDDESRTIAELSNFVVREIRKRQMNVWPGAFLVKGHTFGGAPWSVDTIVSVDDDVSNWHSNMYVLGRTFTNSRQSGPMTHLNLIVPYTLMFSTADVEDSKGKGSGSGARSGQSKFIEGAQPALTKAPI